MCMARFYFQEEVSVLFFVNLLFDQWMHLLETANYPRVMCY